VELGTKMKREPINVEEDGEDVFPNITKCTIWKCNIETNYVKTPLVINDEGFMVCPKCGASYGKEERKKRRTK
jgi:hypothetical protein